MSEKFTFPPGEYYIGDPCYVIGDDENDEWSEFLDAFPPHPNPSIGWITGIAIKWKDQFVWMDSTMWGDGEYKDQSRNVYSVDAGLIGIVPFDLCSNKYDNIEELGRIVKFKDHFQVWRDDDGTFHFGHIRIPTDI